jgi:RNA polymerase sigma-70 factor (TIGR02960 family)
MPREARVNETDLVTRARDGDGDAFDAATAPHRRELLVHCYRMLGSVQDAEDVLQETMLAAWQGLGEFEARSSLRTWLYRIATNRCLNARRAALRRPPAQWNVPGVQPPEPTQLGEVVWLEPLPDDRFADLPHSPEAHYEQLETISLAFVTALQLMPPRQVAVLLLRDVLGFPATEVAGMLDTTVESVTSALKRARATVQRHQSPGHDAPPPAGSDAERALVEKFVRAYEAADVDAVVALLTDDVFTSMPPIPFEYVGPAATAQFFDSIFGAGRRFSLVPTRANGQPAVGAYVLAPDGVRHAAGLFVLQLAGDRICALTRFENTVLPWFGLPRSLPDV